MANSVMRKYEGMFLVDAAAASADWDGILAQINTVLDRAGAEVVSLEKWDDRRLCYEINKRNRGTYILCYFNAKPESLSGIERDVQISDDILRVLILRADRIPQDILDSPTPVKVAEQESSKAEKASEESADSAEGSKEPEAKAEAVAVEAAEPVKTAEPAEAEQTEKTE